MLAAGSRLGDYEVLGRAGSGAVSDVYEGRHVHDGRQVAIKRMRPELCFHVDTLTRFHNEARVLEALKHPRIIALFARGESPEGPPYMVLEWLPHTLEAALQRSGGRQPSQSAVRAATHIAEALCALHDRSIVHRDLKPTNILLAETDLASGELKLADLGLAKFSGGEAAVAGGEGAPSNPVFPVSTGGNDVLGTWEYMAPEQWVQAKTVDARADVYSLGVLLFQMLAGHLPFQAEREKDWMALHLLRSPPIHLLDGLAPPPLRDLIAQMLSKKAMHRPTMPEALSALSSLP
ncbi:serine/threonine-protein kinase [Chondromyces apiculatus]|uniref:Serine/threonine protein kinase n=1 Tax=Chondromyces apiculatus DSM 436 TaxID=1192034 RepID=A0A017T9Q1_9BACT|nr:serine/threonine-protein kinase [Chondromyces apiculatus]EYF05351.1 serine/threonine protein kinase [Chondromyces apiculatus DSM 436]